MSHHSGGMFQDVNRLQKLSHHLREMVKGMVNPQADSEVPRL